MCSDRKPITQSHKCCDHKPIVQSNMCCDHKPIVQSNMCCDHKPIVQSNICCDHKPKQTNLPPWYLSDNQITQVDDSINGLDLAVFPVWVMTLRVSYVHPYRDKRGGWGTMVGQAP
ncbi:hypothetical protein Btru_056449 [Bulinus truncatus]|nr:hypothetical protein Btru_056449 [Bulinus truncatus]